MALFRVEVAENPRLPIGAEFPAAGFALSKLYGLNGVFFGERLGGRRLEMRDADGIRVNGIARTSGYLGPDDVLDVEGAGRFRFVVDDQPLEFIEPRRCRNYLVFERRGWLGLRGLRAVRVEPGSRAPLFDVVEIEPGPPRLRLPAAPRIIAEPARDLAVCEPFSGPCVADLIDEGARVGGVCDPTLAVSIIDQVAETIFETRTARAVASEESIHVTFDGSAFFIGGWFSCGTARHAPQLTSHLDANISRRSLAFTFAELIAGRVTQANWRDCFAAACVSAFADVVGAALDGRLGDVVDFAAALRAVAAPAPRSDVAGYVRGLFADVWRLESGLREAAETWSPGDVATFVR